MTQPNPDDDLDRNTKLLKISFFMMSYGFVFGLTSLSITLGNKNNELAVIAEIILFGTMILVGFIMSVILLWIRGESICDILEEIQEN